MDFDTFKKAVDSMSGFGGIVGIMGGEPTLHPQFSQFAAYFRDHFGVNDNNSSIRKPVRDFVGYIVQNVFNINQNNHRGLWSSTGTKYLDNFEIIQDTFGYQAINDHMNASMHESLMVTRKELGIPDKEWLRLRDKCWIQNLWSASISPKGAFFCEIAAALDMLWDGPGGWPIEPGWWKRKPGDFKEQLHWCELCSAPLAMPRRDAREETDDVSPVWHEKLKAKKSWKMAHDKVKIFDVTNYDSSKYQVINESLPYMEDQSLRISKSNRVFYPEHVMGVLWLKKDTNQQEGERLIKEAAENLELFAVMSDDKSLEEAAVSRGALFWYCEAGDCDTQPWFDELRRSAHCKNQWIALFHSCAPSETLADRLGAMVFNPGCFYFSPSPIIGGRCGEKFSFFNLNAMSLENGCNLLNPVASYPADKVISLGEYFDASAKIYLAYHSSESQKIVNKIFTPIHCGKGISDKQLNMIGDDTGDNISARNREYAELTAHYWAWKNNTHDDYIGLMHYRRLFVFSEGHNHEVNFEGDRIVAPYYESNFENSFGWSSGDILDFISTCDVVVPKQYDIRTIRPEIYDVESHFIAMHGKTGYENFKQSIELYAPDYVESMQEFVKEPTCYLCNMFVMKRWIFERYSEWLFELLEKSAALHAWNADVDPLEQRRMPAFWAERLFNIFLRKLQDDYPHILIKETPYVFLEDSIAEKQICEPLLGIKNQITVVTSFDDNYAPCFGVFLMSMISNSSRKNFYDLIILNDKISEDNQKIFAEMLQQYPHISLRYINMSNKFLRRGATHAHFTKATFNRLILPEMLTAYPKVVYIDPDTILCKDIAELFNFDVGEHYAAASLDLTFKWMRNTCRRFSDDIGEHTIEEYLDDVLGLSTDAKEKFFNAGVMVLNLAKIRQDCLQPIFLRMYNDGTYRTVDQCILNKVFNGNVIHISGKWNHIVRSLLEMHELPREYIEMHREAERDPAILHYAGLDLKPWNNPDIPFSDIFWKYCAMSPYFKHFMNSLRKSIAHLGGDEGVLIRGDYNMPHSGHMQREREINVIRQSNAFDIALYLTENSDVALDEVDPISHYVHHGEGEYRRPNVWFSPSAYKSKNPDIRNDVNAFAHYLQFGIFEDRALS